MAKKIRKKKVVKVKDKFSIGQMTVQDLVESIKSDVVEKVTKREIAKKKSDLKKLIRTRIEPYKKELNKLNAKWKRQKNPFDKLKTAYEIESLENKVNAIDVSSQLNEIDRLSGKDFYYVVNTGFKSHKIMRSEVEKMKDNSEFLKLLRNDVLEEIENLKQQIKDKKETRFDKEKKIKILKDRYLPVINYNISLDKIREFDIDSLDKKLKKEVNLASNTEIERGDKGGKYPIEVIFSKEYIELM